MTYTVKITNGVTVKTEEVRHDGKWVSNQEQAERMVQASINREWKVIK